MKPVVHTRKSLASSAFPSFSPLFSALLASALALATAPAVHAEDAFGDALSKGKTNLELRYRLENVEQAGIANEANASTLRTRLRYLSGEFAQTTLLLELDNVSRVGDDRYNDTRNGKGMYPTVVDPDGTDLNQALIKYMGVANTPVSIGRQRVNLDNQRWIGSVAWRQNEQTLDGVLLEYKGIDKLTATYGYITRVNRINGPDAGTPAPEFDSASHLLNLKYVAGAALTGVAYAYLLDFDPDSLAASSSQTLGLRATGGVPVGTLKLGYTAEFARQSDYGNNAGSFDADYLLGELTLGKAPWEVQLGYEVLGSDAGIAVQTPLATGHKFQGWADKFLATPGGGLVDLYAGVSAKVADIGLTLAYHQYESDTTGATYGDELNLQAMKMFAKRYTVTLKYADYAADTFATDTKKLWLMAEVRF